MLRHIDLYMYQDNSGLYVLTINNTVYQPMTLDDVLRTLREEGVA